MGEQLLFSGPNCGSYDRPGVNSYSKNTRCKDDFDCRYTYSPYCNYSAYRSRSSSPDPSHLAFTAPDRYSRDSANDNPTSTMSYKQPVVISTTERRSKVYIAPSASQYSKGL